MRRLGFTPNTGLAPLIIQRILGYTIILNQRLATNKGKQIVEYTKRILIVREEEPHVEEYSPSQTLMRIEEEELTDEKIEQIGYQGGVFVTQEEIDEGNPQEPPVPSPEQIVVDYRGRELNLILEKANQQFLSDDSFVKSRAFHQFACRENMNSSKERCKNLKTKHQEMDESSIQNEIKEQMIQYFQSITPEEGRQMVKAANILLQPNLDIDDALIFNDVSIFLGLQDPNKKKFLGTSFSNDQDALLMWSLRRESRTISSQPNDLGLIENIILRRVADISHVQEAHMNVDYSQFSLATKQSEEKIIIELQRKYEVVVDAYNKEVQKIIELENKKLGRSKRPRIAYPRPPCEPFNSTPLIQIPDTPQRIEYYIVEDFEEEKNKLWALHVELNAKYEDKLRKALTYFGDKIEWPLVYDQLAKVISIQNEVKASDEALKPIVNK